MPEPTLDDILAPRTDRPPINPAFESAQWKDGRHRFIPSEYAPDSGRCDKCGAGPDHDVHQPSPDHLKRIADALERIAGDLEQLANRAPNPMLSTMSDLYARLEPFMVSIAERLSGSEDPFQRFLRDVFNTRFIAYFEESSNGDGGAAFSDWICAGFPEYWEQTRTILRDPATIERCPIKDRDGFTSFVEGYLSFEPEDE